MEELQMASPESLGIPSGNFLEFYRQLAINKLPLHHFIFLDMAGLLLWGHSILIPPR